MTPPRAPLELIVQAIVDDPIGEELWQQWFSSWLAGVGETQPTEIVLRLTDDQEIRRLNCQYRRVDAVTDVLSFESGEPLILEKDSPRYLGDIVISVPCATRQSQEFRHALEKELAWLAVHGFLHLLGWDHKDEQDWRGMVSRQDELLKGVNVIYDWPRIYKSVS